MGSRHKAGMTKSGNAKAHRLEPPPKSPYDTASAFASLRRWCSSGSV
jgi:hypothetical protein